MSTHLTGKQIELICRAAIKVTSDFKLDISKIDVSNIPVGEKTVLVGIPNNTKMLVYGPKNSTTYFISNYSLKKIMDPSPTVFVHQEPMAIESNAHGRRFSFDEEAPEHRHKPNKFQSNNQHRHDTPRYQKPQRVSKPVDAVLGDKVRRALDILSNSGNKSHQDTAHTGHMAAKNINPIKNVGRQVPALFSRK